MFDSANQSLFQISQTDSRRSADADKNLKGHQITWILIEQLQ